MSWGSSIFVGVVTAAVGGVVAGFVANLAVGWYRISSFEAGSAAFVFGFALLGLVAGFIIGIVASRIVAGGPNPGVLNALGVSHGVLLGIAAVVGVSARLLADVPPTMDGEELMLAVEVRWPEGTTTSPVALPGEPFIRLGSVTGSHTLRASSKGPLWTSDARQVDGRWVAPGAVDIFTTRGSFVLDVVLDSATTHGFLIPLSGKPRSADLEWTEWYPRAKPGAPPLPNGFTYRYRVQKRSQPVRTETLGPFTVTTIAAYFFDEQHGAGSRMAAMSEFTIEHAGKPVAIDGAAADSGAPVRYTRADAVSAIGGKPALLAHFVEPGSNAGGACYLLSDDAGTLQSQLVPDCVAPLAGAPLTADTAVFRKGADRAVARGWFDRVTFANPGLYFLSRTIIDTRRLAVRSFETADDVSIAVSVPPLAVSPDERSFARFAYAEHSDKNPALLVIDVVDNRHYVVPIDRPRMRYPRLEALNPAWVMHHFAWTRGASGVDSLVERTGFVPLPYKGELTLSKDYSAYHLEPAREALREAIIEYLVTEMKGERVAVDSFAYERPVKINGQNVNVAYASTPGYVTVSLDRGATDMSLLQMLAQRLDAVLATGKYDALFGAAPP
jgi:hypothetical protein